MPSIIARDGTCIHYESYGSGSPILLVHGWGLSRVWKNQIEEFSRSYRVITIDLRGHGRSGGPNGEYGLDTLKEDVLALIKELGLKGVTLVGWSMGASVAMKLMAEERPLEVDSLIIVAGTPMFTASYGEGSGRADISGKRGLLETILWIAIGHIRDILRGRGRMWKRLRILLNCGHWAGLDALKGYMKAMANSDLTGILDRIEVPTLIIHGDRDNVCSVLGAYYMADRIKGARLEILNGDDHALCLTDPERVNERMREFVQMKGGKSS